ncbi:MAG TPA: insulinase family protein [Kofleriaceae bacterium]|jgi:zinc protease
MACSVIGKLRRASAVGLLALVWACASYQPPRFAITHYEQRGSLDANGLRFVVMPDPGALQLEVAVRYDVGASDDPDGKAGLAHLVEHLRFQIHPHGDPHTVQYYLERVATGWNAYTNLDETHYYAITSPGQLEPVLQLEAIRLHDGCASISEEEFEREREVVRNEIRQRTGTPEGQVERILAQSLYPAGHPYARTTGGDDAQIAALTRDDACAFMEHYYVPSRATLIVAGRVELAPAMAAIQKWFGGLAARQSAPRRPVAPITVAHGTQTVDLDIERPMVAVSWTIPPIKTIADMHALDEYFDRLALVARAGAIHEFSTRISPLLIGGRGAPVLTFLIELEDLDKVDQALDFTWKSVRERSSVVDHPADEARRSQSELVVGLEPLENRVNHIADLVQLSADQFTARGPLLFHELDTVKTQNLQAVDDNVRRVLDPDRAHVTIFRPNRSGIHGDARASFVFQPPEQLSGSDDTDPDDANSALDVTKDHDSLAGATRYQLDNGLRVVLLPVVSTLPVVTVELVFDSGHAAAPDNPLLASTTARFATPAPSYQYNMMVAGMQVGCAATLDNTTCTARTIGIYTREAIQGLERKFKDPIFDQRSIEHWQRTAANRGERRHRAAEDEVERQLATALYGPDHPYTKARPGALGAEAGISRDAMFAFRDAHFRASNATLIVVGTFDAEATKRIISDSFGGWPRGTPSGAVPPAAPRSQPAYVGVVRDAGPQIDVAIAYPSPGGIGDDQAARLVLERMIANAETRVRERLGATYGTQVFRDSRRGPSRYEVRAALDAARAGEALEAMRDAIDELRRGTNFDLEFVRARRGVAHHLLDESSMSNALASQLALIEEFGQPPGYFEHLLQQVGVLTPGDVSKLLAAELAPAREVVVAAGDRKTLIEAFEGAGIHDYKLVEPGAH